MEILKNFSLKKYNTFKIDAIAENYVSVKNVRELIEVLKRQRNFISNYFQCLVGKELRFAVQEISVGQLSHQIHCEKQC
mgnify:CR=1 FL=1